MYQSYQLRSCLIFVTIIAFITLALRFGDTISLDFWQCAGHVLSVMLYSIIAWLIQGYFRYHRIFELKRNSKAILGLFFSFCCVAALSYFLAAVIPPTILTPLRQLEPEYLNTVQRLARSFFLCMICAIGYNVLESNDFLQKSMLENEQLKQEHLRAQLLSLQEQLSPHFLFNSLSILKTIAADRETKNFVIQLSHIYRYVLNLKDRQVAKLSEEMAFVNSYVYIMQLRFEAALFVEIDIPEDYFSHLIPPLSVQLLVENAVKHNAISIEFPVKIEIFINEREQLVVRNTINPMKIPVESTKLGLRNIDDRFRLLFNQQIEIEHHKQYFIVNLPISRYEDYHH